MHKASNAFKRSVYLLVFLIPLFFLTFTFDVFEHNKFYLLFFLSLAAFLFWIAKMILVDKALVVKTRKLDIFVLAFFFICLASAFFSKDIPSSVFGPYGHASGGILGLFSLVLFYFVVSNNIGEDKKGKEEPEEPFFSKRDLINTLIASSFFALLLTYLSFFGIVEKLGKSFAVPEIMIEGFNPAALKIEGMAVFMSIVLLLLVFRLCLEKSKGLTRFFYILFIFLILYLLALVDFSASWLIIALGLLFFAGYSLWKRMFKEDINGLLFPILLFVFSLVMVFASFSFGDLSERGHAKEAVLPQAESWIISYGSITDSVQNALIGSGIGTFSYDFFKFKPESLILWQNRLDVSGNYIAEIVSTVGILGLASYLVLVIAFLSAFYSFLLKQSREKNPWSFVLFFILVSLVVSHLLYHQNTVLLFVFWLVLALSASLFPYKERRLSLEGFVEPVLVFRIILVFLLAIGGVALFFGGKAYVADYYYAQAVYSDDLDSRISYLSKAVEANPYQPKYKIALSQLHIDKFEKDLTGPMDNEVMFRSACNIVFSIAYARGQEVDRKCFFPKSAAGETMIITGATELSPNSVEAWRNLGIVYNRLSSQDDSALNQAARAFERVAELEPGNPLHYNTLAIALFNSGREEEAVARAKEAIALAPGFIDPYYTLGLIYIEKGDKESAREQLQNVLKLNPNHERARVLLESL